MLGKNQRSSCPQMGTCSTEEVGQVLEEVGHDHVRI